MRALAVPEVLVTTRSAYVPGNTRTVSPGATIEAALLMVRNGDPCDPEAESLPLGET
jgi:hypothetical protein